MLLPDNVNIATISRVKILMELARKIKIVRKTQLTDKMIADMVVA